MAIAKTLRTGNVARSVLSCANRLMGAKMREAEGKRTNPEKIAISAMSKELIAEDFSGAGMKILKDALEDPATRAGLFKAADELHEWLQNFIEKLKRLLLRLAEYIEPKEGGEQSTFDPARIADQFKSFIENIRAFVLHVERLSPSGLAIIQS